jgi:hypothetical protein
VNVSEERKLEADKIQMDYFKQMGTFSLAGAVLIVTLFGAFGRQGGPNTLLIASTVGSVLMFSASLCACAGGLYAIAEDWGMRGPWGGVMRFSRPELRGAFINSLRLGVGIAFFTGAVGFFIAAVGIIAAISGTAH